ncbi:hypothetical protein [Aminobacter aminovorans]|uniref:hypothetical protein n=1 Tax=Aminobacter aminovorans TaxID=83263 RepID=UPI003CCAC927
MSPVSLFQAWQDWTVHPGKHAKIAMKAIEKWNRLVLHLTHCTPGKAVKLAHLLDTDVNFGLTNAPQCWHCFRTGTCGKTVPASKVRRGAGQLPPKSVRVGSDGRASRCRDSFKPGG